MIEEERFAEKLRNAGKRNAKAEKAVAVAEAACKKLIAKTKVMATAKGHKSNAAQENWADLMPEVEEARSNSGVAKGERAAARTEVLACRMEFDEWRTNMATHRKEREVYRA